MAGSKALDPPTISEMAERSGAVLFLRFSTTIAFTELEKLAVNCSSGYVITAIERDLILILERSIDKICGKIAPSARKSDDGVLYVRLGALTQC